MLKLNSNLDLYLEKKCGIKMERCVHSSFAFTVFNLIKLKEVLTESRILIC